MAKVIWWLSLLASLGSVGTTNMLAHPGTAVNQEKSCREFVQEFYDWYSIPAPEDAQHFIGEHTIEEVFQWKSNRFSQQLVDLLRKDRDAQAKAEEIVGLDFDPFVASQDPSPQFKVEIVSVKSGHCEAVVRGVQGSEKHEIVIPELVTADSSWIFINFHYRFGVAGKLHPQKSDLIHLLKLYARDRKTQT